MHFYMAIQKSETYNSYKLLVTNSGLLFLNKKHAFITVFKTSFIEINKPHVLLSHCFKLWQFSGVGSKLKVGNSEHNFLNAKLIGNLCLFFETTENTDWQPYKMDVFFTQRKNYFAVLSVFWSVLRHLSFLSI